MKNERSTEMKKYIVCIMVIAAVILSLVGCANNECELIIEEGNFYIVSDWQQIDQNSQSADAMEVVRYIYFDSLTELRADVIDGNFTEKEMLVLAEWANNDGKARVANVDALIEPVCPVTAGNYVVGMTRENYYFFFANPTDAKSITFHFLTDMLAVNEEISKWQNFDTEIQCEVEKIEIENKGTSYFYQAKNGANIKVHVYELNNNGKTFYVKETYYIDNSATVPYTVKIIGVENERYFSVYVTEPTTCPNADWVCSFGLQDYIATDK